jgi:fibronectin-binding autotransporter adhesin
MRGAGSFEKVGAAILTLSGVNIYTGTTTITAGTLTLADNDVNILPDRSAIILANTAGAILNINGKSAETIGTLSGGGANGGNITLGDGNLTINNRANTTYSGVISGSGKPLVT